MKVTTPTFLSLMVFIWPSWLWATPPVLMPDAPCPSSCQLRITSYKDGVEINPNVYRIKNVKLTSSKVLAKDFVLYNQDATELQKCLDKLDTLPKGKALYVDGSDYHLIDSGLDVFRFNDECSVGPAEPGKIKNKVVVGDPQPTKKKKASQRRYLRGKFKPQSVRKND